MSEYEETDSLTLAVAKAIAMHECGEKFTEEQFSTYEGMYIDIALAAIKAYELHQALTRADLP
jgi:hypothetical protein